MAIQPSKSTQPTVVSVIFIGMPGSGKSTLGRILADALTLPFVDTDTLLTNDLNCSLQDYLDQFGYLALRQLEQQVILKTPFEHSVVATGGSVVYSASAMQYLQQLGTVVYLEVSETELHTRINNLDSRGIACKPNQSFSDLYQERSQLYRQYANLTLNTDDESESESLKKLITLINKERK